jgi:hypothetical protein
VLVVTLEEFNPQLAESISTQFLTRALNQ